MSYGFRPKKVNRIGKGLDICWFINCRATWKLEEAKYHKECQTFKCPKCGRCFCDLPPEIQWALDAEMASIGLWLPWHNPKRRKKRKTPWRWTKSRFLEFVKERFPDLYEKYRRGEISFEFLHGEVMAILDRTIYLE